MGPMSKRSRQVSNYSTNSEDESETDIEIEEEEEEVENEEEEEEEEVEDEEEKEEEEAEFEKDILDQRQEELNIFKNLKHYKKDDSLKGQAVKSQKALWDKTLEFRFLLQKVFSSSNKLPQEPLRSSFFGSDRTVNKAYSDLITTSEQTLDCLLDLQEAIIEKNTSIVQVTNGNTKNPSDGQEISQNSEDGDDEEWLRIQHMHSRIAPFRNKSIDNWHEKIQVASGVAGVKRKLQAFNQNISDQVSGYMRDPSKMIKRMQLKRSTVGIIGDVPDVVDNTEEEGANVDGDPQPTVDGDPELLDDSEFYQQLLKEFFESFDPTSSEAAVYALKRLQKTKKRKNVDRRASKSRKIRYKVHEKIVNFMAPEPMNLPPMAPTLFENLFGRKNQKPTSVA